MSYSTVDHGYNTEDQDQRKKHWNVRNDSSNVSGALNSEAPNSEQESNNCTGFSKPVLVSNHCYKTCKLPKFFCAGCYCRKLPVCPKFAIKKPTEKRRKLKKPKCKLTHICCQHGCRCDAKQLQSNSKTSIGSNASPKKKNSVEKKESNTAKNVSKETQTKETPKTVDKGSGKSLPVSKGDKSLKSQPLKSPKVKDKGTVPKDLNKPTENQKDKEKHRASSSKNSSYFLPAFSESIRERCTTSESEDDICCAWDEDFNCCKSTPNCQLKDLNMFRQENYFECYSVPKLLYGNSPQHQCVHKFVLDDRLIPQPLYADGFGTSRCTECDKPIKCDVTPSKDNSIFTKPIVNHQTNFFKNAACCVDRQTKHKINIGAKNDRIEIKVPISSSHYNELFNMSYKIKNPVSANSLALRHQKGVV